MDETKEDGDRARDVGPVWSVLPRPEAARQPQLQPHVTNPMHVIYISPCRRAPRKHIDVTHGDLQACAVQVCEALEGRLAEARVGRSPCWDLERLLTLKELA
jgi:hypothetical protein